jgi:hypothetical protein
MKQRGEAEGMKVLIIFEDGFNAKEKVRYCWDHSNDEFMDNSLVIFMMHKEEGGGSPQDKGDIQTGSTAT